MSVLVTGAGGFVGRFLMRSFGLSGMKVVATYRNTRPELEDDLASTVHLVRVDLSDGLGALGPVDTVVHAAAHTHLIPNSTADDYIRTNVIGTLNLARYAKAMRPRLFVYLSTVSVHGEIEATELDENTPINRPGMYGLTKYLGELTLQDYARHFPSVSIRLPGVVGRGDFRPWIGRVLKTAVEGKPITVYNPRSMFNNIVDLAEVRDFICWINNRGLHGCEYVNLSASEPLPIGDVVEYVISLTHSKSKVIEQETMKKSFSISGRKLRDVFGFEPSTTRSIISRYVNENLPLLKSGELDA